MEKMDSLQCLIYSITCYSIQHSLLKKHLEFLAPYIVADTEYEHLYIGLFLEYIETQTVHNHRTN